MSYKLPSFDDTTPEERKQAIESVLETYSLKNFDKVADILNSNLIEQGHIESGSQNKDKIKHDIVYNKQSYEAISLALETGLRDKNTLTEVGKNAIDAVKNSQNYHLSDTITTQIEDAKTYPLAPQSTIIATEIPANIKHGHLHNEKEKNAAEKILASLEGDDATSLKQLNKVLKSMGVEQISNDSLKNGLSFNDYEKTVGTLKSAISEWQEAHNGDKTPPNTVRSKGEDGRVHDVLYTKR